ncbi:MAG: hypothetical protein HUU21_15195, partial [Polyangiaceae bacterium]|nr:hypothetical protein [Polyangiaceae bacterium]
RALPPAGVWDAHFKGWAKIDEPRAAQAAEEAFRAIAAAFSETHGAAVDAEQRELDAWLRIRALELCGPPPKQLGLFEKPSPDLPRFKTATSDSDRLAAYAADGAEPPRRRSQAQTVLRIHSDRAARLAGYRELSAPSVLPLGLLLLVAQGAKKEGRHGA